MPRHLRNEEKELIVSLVRGLPVENIVLADLDGAIVADMDDGGMGSIAFRRSSAEDRRFGREVVQATFVDSDGIPVSITINLDQNDRLFEMDLFKADNSALRNYPRPQDVTIITNN